MKNTSKKVMALVLAVMMVVGLIPACVLSAIAAPLTQVTITGVPSDANVKVTLYDSEDDSVIPYDGSAIVEIGTFIKVKYEIVDSSAYCFDGARFETSFGFLADTNINFAETYEDNIPEYAPYYIVEEDVSAVATTDGSKVMIGDLLIEPKDDTVSLENGTWDGQFYVGLVSENKLLKAEITVDALSANIADFVREGTILTAMTGKDFSSTPLPSKLLANPAGALTGVSSVKIWARERVQDAKYSITDKTTDTNGTVTVINEAKSGTSVAIAAAPADGYALDTLKVTKSTDSTYELVVKSSAFFMPSFNVDVTATFKKIKGTITDETTDDNGSITVASSALYGSTVVVTVNADEGYALDTLQYNDGSDHDIIINAGVYSFVMPEADVTVTATFKSITGIITDGTADDNGTITVPSSAIFGEEVVVITNPADGYAVATLIYNDGSDHEITYAGGKYSFIMPESDVTVIATFERSNESLFDEYKQDTADFVKDYFKNVDYDGIVAKAIEDILGLEYDENLTLDENKDRVDDILTQMFDDIVAWKKSRMSAWEAFVAWLQDTYEEIMNTTFIDENGIHVQNFLNKFFNVTLVEGAQLAKAALDEAIDNVGYGADLVLNDYLDYVNKYKSALDTLINDIYAHVTYEAGVINDKANEQFEVVYAIGMPFLLKSREELVANGKAQVQRMSDQINFLIDNTLKFGDALTKYTGYAGYYFNVIVPTVYNDHLLIVLNLLENSFVPKMEEQANYVWDNYLSKIPAATQMALDQVAKVLGLESFSDIKEAVKNFIDGLQNVKELLAMSYEEALDTVMKYLEGAMEKVENLILQYRIRYFDGYKARKITYVERLQNEAAEEGDEAATADLGSLIFAIQGYEFDVSKSVEENRAVIDGMILNILKAE